MRYTIAFTGAKCDASFTKVCKMIARSSGPSRRWPWKTCILRPSVAVQRVKLSACRSNTRRSRARYPARPEMKILHGLSLTIVKAVRDVAILHRLPYATFQTGWKRTSIVACLLTVPQVKQQGQKVAVVGESGSGKSTIMALLETCACSVGDLCYGFAVYICLFLIAARV